MSCGGRLSPAEVAPSLRSSMHHRHPLLIRQRRVEEEEEEDGGGGGRRGHEEMRGKPEVDVSTSNVLVL